MYKPEKMYLSIIAILCIARVSFGDDSSQSQLICGTDGITYKTADDFKEAQNNNPDLEEKIEGPCWEEIYDDVRSDGALDLNELLDQVVPSDELSAIAEDLMGSETEKIVIKAITDLFKAMAETDALEIFVTAYYRVVEAVLQRRDIFEKVEDIFNDLNEILEDNPDAKDAVMEALRVIAKVELHDSAADDTFITLVNHFDKLQNGEL